MCRARRGPRRGSRRARAPRSRPRARAAHADDRTERPCRVEPRDGVLGRLDAAPQVLDRRLHVERERLREPELQQHGGRRSWDGAPRGRGAGRRPTRRARRAAARLARRRGACRTPSRGRPARSRADARPPAPGPRPLRPACAPHARGRPSARPARALVDRAADDRVNEQERATLGQDPPGAQGVGRFGGLLVVELRDRGGVPDERVPEDGGRAGEPPGGRESGRAAPGPTRPRPRARRRAPRRRGRGRPRATPRELAEEERVPAGQRVAGAAEGRQGLGHGAAHEARRGGVGERLGPQRRGRATLGQQLGDRGAAGLAERPGGDHEHHRRAAEPPREVRQEPQATPSAHCASSTSNASGWLSARWP